jgi:hypothetical protein
MLASISIVAVADYVRKGAVDLGKGVKVDYSNGRRRRDLLEVS